MRYFFFIFALGLFFPLVSFAATTQPGFVSLTDIPIFNSISGAVDISTVLNGIYGLCIGLSAALAVGMIMWGGLMYMGGDSITEKKAARAKITHAILGLLLVLSPAIVFGIIDKRILSLSIDTSPLTSAGSTTSGGVTSSDVQSIVWESTASNAASVCAQQGGTVTEVGGGTIRCTKSASACLVYPAGTTAITADAQSCCSAQSGCTLNVGTRSQYSCTCASTTTTTNTSGTTTDTTATTTTNISGSCTPTNSSGCTYSGEDVGDTTCQNYKEGSAIPAKGDANYGVASTCCNNVPNKVCTVLTPLGGGTSTCGCR